MISKLGAVSTSSSHSGSDDTRASVSAFSLEVTDECSPILSPVWTAISWAVLWVVCCVLLGFLPSCGGQSFQPGDDVDVETSVGDAATEGGVYFSSDAGGKPHPDSDGADHPIVAVQEDGSPTEVSAPTDADVAPWPDDVEVVPYCPEEPSAASYTCIDWLAKQGINGTACCTTSHTCGRRVVGSSHCANL